MTGATAVTLATHHARLAGALATERFALEALRALTVALALQGAVVVVGGEREHRVAAETCGNKALVISI